MSRVLEEYFASVNGSDAHDYSYAPVRDFLSTPYPDNSYDWVITNPPFRLAQEFGMQAQRVARVGVAVLVRTTFVEAVGRYEKMFRDRPPSVVAQFAERVPMLKGRLDPKASTATAYAWLLWLPPCRKRLELQCDYGSRVSPQER